MTRWPVVESFPRKGPDAVEVEARRCVEPPPRIGVGIREDYHLRGGWMMETQAARI